MIIKSTAQIILVVFICIVFIPANCTNLYNEHETINLNISQKNDSKFSHFLGINAFEWDFLDNTNMNIDERKLNVMQSFGGFRHYMDWERIESEKEKFTFNPTHSGGSNYDAVYQTCYLNNITVLACLKNCPQWLVNTYPKDQRDVDNVTAPYGLDRSAPASYLYQAKAGFQFAARYGSNKHIDNALINVNKIQRWNGDPSNQVEIGLGYVKYIECNNEVDKTWKGPKAHQSPEEHAANLSAFYDGDMGRLGKDVGVKNADPSIQVVMSGLGMSGPEYVIGMVNWCKKHRGLKADGSVNLCFDVINYHFYNNNASFGKDNATTGVAPELSPAAKQADDFVAMSKKYANNLPVWITEAGYDINPGSIQRAPKIGDKPALISQADWMLRSSLLYARHGLKASFFYMLDDAGNDKTMRFATSGFTDGYNQRPVADYFLQVKVLLGEYHYEKTISKTPIVDIYKMRDKKIYVIYIPDQVDRKELYELDLQREGSVKIHYPTPGTKNMHVETLLVKNKKIKIKITETPIFIEDIN